METPRLIYLAILGFVLLAYLYREYRGRMGTALQSALIWVLIFVAAVILYGFKDVFRTQVFSNSAVSLSENTLRLPQSFDGHYYADLIINGIEVEFVVDTGATSIVLSHSDAARAGIPMDNLRYFGTAETANGDVRVAGIMLSTVKLADWVDYDLRALVTEGDTSTSLLGMTYLSRFSRIEIVDGTLLLHR